MPEKGSAGEAACDIDQGPCSFRVFSDRSAADLEAFEWNSTMDLLACLTAPPDSTLSIYRLLAEDQSPKLLSEKVTGIGTALAWSPCGRRVAVGDRLGGISIFDGESGAVLRTQRPHAHPVVTLSWVAAGPKLDSAEGNWCRMLPPLLALPSAPSNMYAEMPEADLDVDGTSDVFSLLVSADEGGKVVVSAGGTFPLQATSLFDGAWLDAALARRGHVPSDAAAALAPTAPDILVRESQSLGGRRIRAARLSPDLRLLAVLVGPPGAALQVSSPVSAGPPRSPPGAPAAASLGGYPLVPEVALEKPPQKDDLVVVLDVRKFAVRRQELMQASSMVERLLAIVAYTRQAVDTLANVWRGAAEGFANKMRGLSEAVGNFQTGDNPSCSHKELLVTCCTGSPTDAVHAFLTRQTSPQQLARLERSLVQALEYVNLITCTRLQVASQHLLTTLQELLACAGWTQKFQAIGLDVTLLQNLLDYAKDFVRLTELLLLECGQARRFVRTLFQVMLRMAHRLAEPPAGNEPSGAGVPSPTKEDMDEFVALVLRRQSLELKELTERIGSVRNRAAGASVGFAAPMDPSDPTSSSNARRSKPTSLMASVQRLRDGAALVAERMVAAMSARCAPIACLEVCAPPPWAVVGVPELRAAAAAAEISRRVASPSANADSSAVAIGSGPCKLGGSTLSMTWEGSQLLLLWSAAAPAWKGTHDNNDERADLHLCRCSFPPAPPSAPVRARLERLRLHAKQRVDQSKSHFLLCQMYDASRVVALVLHEQAAPNGAALAVVCLLDISECTFQAVSCFSGSAAGPMPPAVSIRDLPDDAVRTSAPLPDGYVWASAMRVMATRGVCSVYAQRARRLLTLDMDAEADDEDENGDDDA